METRILPINENPSITTYVHYAYPCAIIESRELTYVRVNGLSSREWKILSYDTSVQMLDDRICVTEQGSGDNENAVIWRECDDPEALIICMDYVKPKDFSRYVDIFLFDEDLQQEVKAEDKSCGIRWNPYGFFIGKEMYGFDTKVYIFVKFCVEEDRIYGYASKDGCEWDYIDSKEIPACYRGKKKNIGIHMYFGKNCYPIWKKMNFIQLLYNESDPYKGVWLDYYFFPRKNMDNSYGVFSNFLDVHYDSLYDALDCFKSIHEYIRWNIRHMYYVNICLDEFYVPERAAYQREHYDHYNLFYGFDDEKRVYHIMGYGKKGTLVVSELPYEVLDGETKIWTALVRYKYSTNEVTLLKFNLRAVTDGLYEFLNDVDSSGKVSNLLAGEKVSYGISILKALIETEEGRANIRQDQRIAFCLSEHCKLMKERLDYLYENAFVKAVEYESLAPLCDEMVHTASILLVQVLKNMLKPVQEEIIDNNLRKLYELERRFCENLLGTITKNV